MSENIAETQSGDSMHSMHSMQEKVSTRNWSQKQARPNVSIQLPAWQSANTVSGAGKLSINTIQHQTER
jgi:hypothetical protein